MFFEDWYSLDSLESLGGDNLCIFQAEEPAAPPITLDLVMEVAVPRGARSHKNMM